MKQQSGETILGFIIGVVFGLAAALAVAVYVTKVPVPFVNKGQTRSADQDAAEAKKNKDWDPNAPLYGKSPMKAVPPSPPSSAVAPALPPAVVSSGPPAVVGRPDAGKPGVAKTEVTKSDASKVDASGNKIDNRADTKPGASADPLGDLARAKSSGSVAEPFSYFVQVGAYRTPEDAETQRAKLSLSGIEARVTEREQAGRVVYRVRAGPFDKKEDADRIKEKLESAGLETALVRVQR